MSASWKERDLSTPARVALLAIPIGIGTLSIFLLRRLDKGEWDLGEPVVAVFIAVALLAPGAVFLAALVRNAILFLVGLLLLSVSAMIGVAAAEAGGGDGQAGVNLLVTPMIALASSLVLAWIDRVWRAREVGAHVDDSQAGFL